MHHAYVAAAILATVVTSGFLGFEPDVLTGEQKRYFILNFLGVVPRMMAATPRMMANTA